MVSVLESIGGHIVSMIMGSSLELYLSVET